MQFGFDLGKVERKWLNGGGRGMQFTCIKNSTEISFFISESASASEKAG